VPTGKYVVMRTAGLTSWRLDVSDSDLAEMALFVRDAVGLTVPSTAGVPPALDSPVADRRNVLSDRDRAEASAQWQPWWQQILELEFGLKSSLHRPPAEGRGPDALAEIGTVGDVPDLTALAHVPQLRAAVQASFEDVSRWRQRRMPQRGAPFEGDVVRQAVDNVAFDRQVPVNTLSGALLVLPVVGLWWQRIAPGQVLCSQAATRSSETNYRIVYEVFASCLGQ
jgi:hypothetical protein